MDARQEYALMTLAYLGGVHLPPEACWKTYASWSVKRAGLLSNAPYFGVVIELTPVTSFRYSFAIVTARAIMAVQSPICPKWQAGCRVRLPQDQDQDDARQQIDRGENQAIEKRVVH
jgi:hypothetical protein